MPCGREGNRRSGVALAMRHRLQWFIHLRAHGLDREMSTPPTLLMRQCAHAIDGDPSILDRCARELLLLQYTPRTRTIIQAYSRHENNRLINNEPSL